MNRNQTPARLRHTVALAVGLGCSSAAISIGLGPIHVNSSIGQPMSATIPVDGLTAASAKGATVQLASAAAYRARGIELLPSHQKLRFSLVPSGKGYVIRVTSSAAIREPFVNFLITINSNGSTVTREYAAFFNPDPLNPNAAEPMAVVEKPTLADNGGKGKKKGKKDKLEQPERQLLTVGEPESRATLAESKKAAKAEPALANPKKEKNKKDKAKEQIAARKQNTPRAASADTQGWGGHDIATKPKQATPAVAERGNSGEGGYSYFSPEVKPGSIPVGSKYGPVKSNETLFSIANAARPSDNVSIQEMMRAIYNANRNAFARNDMDNLMVGSTLIIPDPGAANGAAAVEVADSGKDKAEAKKAEKAAQDKADAADTAKAAAAVAATEEALAQNDNSDAKAATEAPAPMPEPAPEVAQNDNAAEKTADEQAAATPAVELAQNDAPADAANGSSDGGALDGNTLTLDGADSLAANAPQIAENSDAAAASDNVAPADENNAIEIAANDAAADDTVAPAENSEIAAETPAAASVEVASNDNSAATETTPATVPEMKPETIVAVADEKPEDKVSSGLPLPLLAAAGAGALTLGGAAAYMIAKRKRRDDDEDGIEEFSQEAVDRLAAEIDADDSGDRVSEVKVRNAAPNGGNVDGLERLNSQLSELDELNKKFSGLPKYRDEYDDGEPHSADELPDDFFKDLEIPADESVAAATVVAHEEPAAITAPPASDSSEDDDFFSDLEKLAEEDKTEAPLANGHAKHGEFDDFLSLSKDDSSAKAEPKISVNKSAEPAPAEADDFDDFLAFMEEEDTSAKQPAASEPAPVAAAETAEDDFDFLSFAEEEATTPAKAAEPEPVAAAEAAEDDFDFLSFAEEETAAPAKAAEAAPVAAAETTEDDFDFLSFAEEETTAPAKAAEPAPVAAAETAEDDFDFLSFAEEETAVPAKTAEPAPVAAAETAEDDFDFLSFAEEETAVPAKAAETAPVAVEEVAADDDGLDFFASEEDEKPATPHTVVSDAVVIAAAPEEAKDDGALDFFALEDEPAPAVEVENIAESKPVAEAAAVADAVVAPAASDADEDVEAMEINLDMATSFIVMGKAEKARSWLDEVMESGSESQKVRARSMLAQLDK